MSPRRSILRLTGLVIAGLIIAFFDSIHTTYSAATGHARSWVKSSSPMRGHLAYVWEHWEDPNLKESKAIRDLSAILQSELSADSTSEEIKSHIRKHFQRPVFESVGAVPATIWRQEAHGYTALFLDDYRVLRVRYLSRNDRFLYVDVFVDKPKGSDLRQIDLTPSVDLWANPTKNSSLTEPASK